MRRQYENVYAINEDTEVHFAIRNGRAAWAIVYTGGLLMDVVRRVGESTHGGKQCRPSITVCATATEVGICRKLPGKMHGGA